MSDINFVDYARMVPVVIVGGGYMLMVWWKAKNLLIGAWVIGAAFGILHYLMGGA